MCACGITWTKTLGNRNPAWWDQCRCQAIAVRVAREVRTLSNGLGISFRNNIYHIGVGQFKSIDCASRVSTYTHLFLSKGIRSCYSVHINTLPFQWLLLLSNSHQRDNVRGLFLLWLEKLLAWELSAPHVNGAGSWLCTAVSLVFSALLSLLLTHQAGAPELNWSSNNAINISLYFYLSLSLPSDFSAAWLTISGSESLAAL